VKICDSAPPDAVDFARRGKTSVEVGSMVFKSHITASECRRTALVVWRHRQCGTTAVRLPDRQAMGKAIRDKGYVRAAEIAAQRAGVNFNETEKNMAAGDYRDDKILSQARLLRTVRVTTKKHCKSSILPQMFVLELSG